MSEQKSVIPFDLPLGASRQDGNGGSERLNREARSDPARYLRLQASQAPKGGAFMAQLSTRGGRRPVSEICRAFVRVVSALDGKRAFYTRLLNRKHRSFSAVEHFFRDVVDPVLRTRGFSRTEVGTDPPQRGFMNVEIFDGLHFSDVVICDVTGERPNCYMELGYALGRLRRTIVTAMAGTILPFDQQAIPCFFWSPARGSAQLRREFVTFFNSNLNRPPLVEQGCSAGRQG
jgi:hypothetical protein